MQSIANPKKTPDPSAHALSSKHHTIGSKSAPSSKKHAKGSTKGVSTKNGQKRSKNTPFSKKDTRQHSTRERVISIIEEVPQSTSNSTMTGNDLTKRSYRKDYGKSTWETICSNVGNPEPCSQVYISPISQSRQLSKHYLTYRRYQDIVYYVQNNFTQMWRIWWESTIKGSISNVNSHALIEGSSSVNVVRSPTGGPITQPRTGNIIAWFATNLVTPGGLLAPVWCPSIHFQTMMSVTLFHHFSYLFLFVHFRSFWNPYDHDTVLKCTFV